MDKILTNAQLQFANEAKSVAKKIEMKGIKTKNSSPDVSKKIIIVKENLDLLIKNLNNGGTARVEFMKGYPIWSKKRRECIKNLREIAVVMDSDRFTSNVSRLVSYVTSLAGGGLVLSTILMPFTLGLSALLSTVGGILIATGTVGSFGTAFTELLQVQSNINKAQQVITEDKELFQRMCTWVEHQTEVLKIDIVQDIISRVKKFVQEGMQIENVPERLKYMETELKRIMTHSSNIMKISVNDIKTLMSLSIDIYMLMSNIECQFSFACASLTVRSTTGAVLLVDEIADLPGLVSNAVAKTAVFSIIGITLDTAGIILTSNDILQGSYSSQATRIFDVADEMEKEAEVMRNVYNNLSIKRFLSFFLRCLVLLLLIIWFYLE